MTAEELAKELKVSRPWIFTLKKKFPKEVPRTFDDVDAWKKFLQSTRTAVKVKPVKAGKSSGELSDLARLTRARANKVEHEDEILIIELEATHRKIIRQEEVIALFSQIATVVRGRLMKMRNDLPSALLGLDAPSIDRVVADKFEYALQPFVIPQDFFNPRSVV